MKKINVIKLTRDLLPEICKKNDFKATFYQADQDEYIERLQTKLQEEVGEYLADNSVEELVDILEVVYALAQTHNTSIEQLEIMRRQKVQKRGAFEKRLIIQYEKE